MTETALKPESSRRKRKIRQKPETILFGAERKVIILLELPQASPSRPSDRSNMKMNILLVEW
jgi:hypothetical protein